MQKTAVVFPGQGSQRPGMGQDFYQNFSTARRIFEQASEAMQLDMAALCFEEDPRLDQTEFTQPAILTVEFAMLQVIKEVFGFSPDLFAGHSLGEYTALVAADVIPFADAVRLVRRRGALMQEAVAQGRGAMSAVIKANILQSGVEKIVLQYKAEIANYNSQEQLVISGEALAVNQAARVIEQEIEGARAVPLNVSAPFHSSLMKTIEPQFASYLNELSANCNKEKAARVVSNFSGDFHKPSELLQNLVKQISGSVRWLQNMQVLQNSAEEIVEVGPNRVLTKFFASIANTDADADEKIKTVASIINWRSAQKFFKN